MSKVNHEIAEMFYKIADILDSQGVKWKPEAYREAAGKLELLDRSIAEIYEEEGIGGVKKIKGIGEDLARKIIEYIEEEKISKYEELKEEAPYDVEALTSLSTIGPKKALKLYQKLDIKNVADLKEAAKHGRVRKLEGFGEKSEQDILEAIKLRSLEREERVPLELAQEKSEELKKELNKVAGRVEIAGSIRRKRDTIGDIDILATSSKPREVVSYFCNLSQVKKVLAKGPTKSMVLLKSGLQADLRVVKEENFGAAMLYFSGSKSHNIWLRKKARKKGYKLNEYGLFDRETGEKVASKTEKAIYNALGMKYIPPERRRKFS